MSTQPKNPPPRSYLKVRALAEPALAHLRQKIEQAASGLGDPYLVRASVAAARIKSPSSLARKAQQRGWDFEEALSKVQDLIGFRFVCHNLQDVRRVADLIEESLRRDGLAVKRDDYTGKPKRDGYRSMHLVFRMKTRLGNDEAEFGCEIQIRSLLQDSWAQLSRADVYSGEAPVPTVVTRRMVALSKLLARADKIADGIRKDIVRPRRGRRPQSGQTLTDSAVAFLYRSRFGGDPPDYLVRVVRHDTEGMRLRADGLEVALGDEKLLDRLNQAYLDASGWDPEPPQLFRWVVLSLLVGTDGALRRAASEGRQGRREIEVIGRREALADVPKIDDILNGLEKAPKDADPEWDLERWASALGATNDCACCGTTIVDPDQFAEAAVRYFKVRGKKAEALHERLAEAARSTAVETGSWGSSTVCSYCNHVLSKD